jgi:hypothetical protein
MPKNITTNRERERERKLRFSSFNISAMKKTLIIFCAVFLFFGLSATAQACTRYWVGGGLTAAWNATGNTNWSLTSGGANNAAVPTTTDDVCFDGVGGGNSPSTLSAAITIQSLDMTGYVNTLTHAATTTLTVAGNVTFASGMTYTRYCKSLAEKSWTKG